MKKFRSIIFFLALIIFSTGCVKEQPKPDLPPSQSLVLEIDNIWKNSPTPGAYPSGIPGPNFVFAASSVYWWNLVLTVQMVIPVAAFLECFKHEPIWDRSSLSWVWSYSMVINNENYSAELFAETISGEVNWSMYVSKEGDYTDLLWFTGLSKTDNSSGSWIIQKDPNNTNKDPEESVPYLQINWSVEGGGLSEITYTNIEEGSVEKGSYISYGIVDDPKFDAFYDIYRIGDDNLVSVKWNRTTQYGSVLSMVHFKDPYWHCWNDLFQNIACE